jgi:hypothetical protein
MGKNYGEEIVYLFSQFDAYLKINYKPETAWNQALEDYHYVFHVDDGRLPLARASELALAWLEKHGELQ